MCRWLYCFAWGIYLSKNCIQNWYTELKIYTHWEAARFDNTETKNWSYD